MFFKFIDSGTETYINLDQITEFHQTAPTTYGTVFFTVSLSSGMNYQLDPKDAERFLKVFNSKMLRNFTECFDPDVQAAALQKILQEDFEGNK